jgi:hypothetical protein
MKDSCMISLGLGCDVYLQGVPGITAKVVHKFLLKLKQDMVAPEVYFDKLLENFASNYSTKTKKKNGINVSIDDIFQYWMMLEVFVDCSCFEPTNYELLRSITGNLSNDNIYIDDECTPISMVLI